MAALASLLSIDKQLDFLWPWIVAVTSAVMVLSRQPLWHAQTAYLPVQEAEVNTVQPKSDTLLWSAVCVAHNLILSGVVTMKMLHLSEKTFQAFPVLEGMIFIFSTCHIYIVLGEHKESEKYHDVPKTSVFVGEDTITHICLGAFCLMTILILRELPNSTFEPASIGAGVLQTLRLLSLYNLTTLDLSIVSSSSQLAAVAVSYIFQPAATVNTLNGIFIFTSSVTIAATTFTSVWRGTRRLIFLLMVLPWIMLTIPPLIVDTLSTRYAPLGVTTKLHPIEQLWLQGQQRFEDTLRRQSKTVDEAIAEYRRRHNREPPAGFDAWANLALNKGLIFIDEFDNMLEAFRVLRGLSPETLVAMVEGAIEEPGGDLLRFDILDHQAIFDESHGSAWLGSSLHSWLTADPAYLAMLPNLRFALNTYDEPRVVIPSDFGETIMSHVLRNGDNSNQGEASGSQSASVSFLRVGQQHAWPSMVLSCPASSPARDVAQGQQNKTQVLDFVSNYTASQDTCEHPEFAVLHGIFNDPESLRLTHSPVPIWSQAKPSTFNDILLPSPWYAETSGEYDPAEDSSWESKQNSVYWMGSATGGHMTTTNWRNMQRQRLVLATMPDSEPRDVVLLNETSPGHWVNYTKDSKGLQNLFSTKIMAAIQCDDDACAEESVAFHLDGLELDREPVSASYSHKYVLDLDGNGFSGRFYRLLGSRSTVIKQTIFKEWHDDWLIPWVHFIPLSLQGDEVWEIMHFFATTERGDEIGKSIAEMSQEWSQKVLRTVDMELVFLRLLLEYGDLVNPARKNV